MKDKKGIDVAKRETTMESLKKIKTFLEAHGVRIPENFDRKIREEASRFNGGRIPQIPAIINLLKCCEYWKKYCVTEEEYNKLVCAACYNMAWIQCSVISTHTDSRSYIGNFCKVKEENLPECTTTVANTAEKALVYEGMGAAEKVLPPLL